MKKQYERPVIKNVHRAVSGSSKYTINHISHFHKTINTIVLQQKVYPVSLDDQKYLVAFSHLMVRLLQGPQLSYRIIENPNSKELLHPIRIRKSKLARQTTKPSLRQILDWMADVVCRPDLTMEILLDEYYFLFPFATMDQLLQVDLIEHTVFDEEYEVPVKKSKAKSPNTKIK